MALTKVTGQVIKNTTDVTVGVLTVTNTLAVGGTVSIGGTLTYEDVTNVDAVGLVTARNGIVVGSGITLSKDGDGFFTGIVTATTFSGALAASSLTGALPAISGANLTNLDASDLASGTVPTARLGSGTASSSTFLRGDSTFAAVTSTTINSNTNNYLITGTGTADTLQGESGLTYDGTTLSNDAVTRNIQAGYNYVLIGSSDANGASITLDGDSNGDGAGVDYAFIEHNTDGDLVICGDNPANASNIIFKTNSTTERLRIDSSGRLLVGTTTEGNGDADEFTISNVGGGNMGMTIRSATGALGNIFFSDGTSGDSEYRGMLQYGHNNDSMRFSTAATERARIDSSGKLFLGTTSGGDASAAIRAKQGVAIDSSYTDYLHGCYEAQVTINSGGQNKQIGILNAWDGNIHATSIAVYYNGGYGLAFAVNDDTNDRPLERATISKEGVASFNSTSHVFNATTSQAAGGSSYYCYRGHHSGGTISFNVWSNGNVQNTNNSYSNISDIKLKENIVDANSQWEDIKAIKVRNFNFKAETKHETHTQIGVIAQEIETICPKLVTEIPDIDSEGNDLGTTTKSVASSVLYMKAIKCLQEAITKIETLEAKVAALEG